MIEKMLERSGIFITDQKRVKNTIIWTIGRYDIRNIERLVRNLLNNDFMGKLYIHVVLKPKSKYPLYKIQLTYPPGQEDRCIRDLADAVDNAVKLLSPPSGQYIVTVKGGKQ